MRAPGFWFTPAGKPALMARILAPLRAGVTPRATHRGSEDQGHAHHP